MDLPPFRPSQRSLGIFAPVKLGGKSASRDGDQDHCLLRRLPPSPSESCYSQGTGRKGYSFSDESGMGSEFRKVNSFSCKGVCFSRPALEYDKEYGSSSTSQAEGSQTRSSDIVVKSLLELGDRKKDSRKIKLCSIPRSSWTPPHEGDAEGLPSSSRMETEESVSSSSTCLNGNALVAKPFESILGHLSSQPGCFHELRRIGERMGSTNRGKASKRSVDSGSVEVAHKHKGIDGHFPLGSAKFGHVEGKDSGRPVRQSDSGLLYQEARGHTISPPYQRSVSPLKILQTTGHNAYPPVFAREAQQHSGLFIPGQAFNRLEAIKQLGSPNFPKVGDSRDRPVWIQSFQGSKSICLKRHDGSRSRIYRCVQSSLEFQSCLDFPTASLDTQSPLPPQLRSGDLHFGGATMGEGLLETRSEEQSHCSSHPDSQCKSPPVGKPDGQASPTISQNIFGGMENTWWASTTRSWPEEDRSLLEKAWRKSTLKTYSSPWKQWLAWCAKIKSDPMQPEAGVLARYLSFLFRVKCFAPATIRVHKSVIVSLVDPVHGEALAASSLVRHMVKAIEVSYSSSMGPAKVIWDVSLLISWLKSEILDETSLYQVSRRLSLILLLASGRRIHDLTLLRMDNEYMTLGDGYVCFWPAFGSKTDRSSHRQSGWKLLKVGDKALDPVHWSSKLLEVSASRRAARENLFNLFITTRGKVGPASRAIIAGWVQSAFRSAGINFPPGSIRSAVASTRRKDHLPLDTILQCGNWAGEGNVFRYYFREIQPQETVEKTTLVSDNSFVPV
ncbi:unnamed protein product [Callosobruchus maculatus]|uniref:Tyr recombinase domain-containing protein n=1 Tax=Callosobruchus maculatus TaxID=64391 RepID=A0A653CZJ7_CALMS|nr:unnamed protein product [Callosobruchus maculatus]